MRVLWVAIVSTTLIATAGNGQSRQNPVPIMPPTAPGANIPSIGRGDPTANDPLNSRMEQQQLRSRNSDRQKRLVSDTDKLMALVKQLKEEVETPGKSLEPNEVQKRAEEIEKLAKSVKDRMKG
jgi:hypothetical protein